MVAIAKKTPNTRKRLASSHVIARFKIPLSTAETLVEPLWRVIRIP
jgi:hypothetical protein